LGFTPLLCLKRCHACDQPHSCRASTTFLLVDTVNHVATLKAHKVHYNDDCSLATEFTDFQGITTKTKTLDVRDMFLKQLTQIHSMTVGKALAIVEVQPLLSLTAPSNQVVGKALAIVEARPLLSLTVPSNQAVGTALAILEARRSRFQTGCGSSPVSDRMWQLPRVRQDVAAPPCCWDL
jgi:hypothetical protein